MCTSDPPAFDTALVQLLTGHNCRAFIVVWGFIPTSALETAEDDVSGGVGFYNSMFRLVISITVRTFNYAYIFNTYSIHTLQFVITLLHNTCLYIQLIFTAHDFLTFMDDT